jgi:protein TonB
MSLNATLPEAIELPPRPTPTKIGRSRSVNNTKSLLTGSPSEPSVIWSILTTSAALHLLLVGFLGSGVPKPAPVRSRLAVPPPSAVEVVQDVKVEPEPELTPPPPAKIEDQPLQAEPPAAANLDLPSLAQVEPIAAVSSSVPVAFGIEVKGPVRLVSDASRASGRIGGRGGPVPISLDDDALNGKELLLPPIVYPAAAQARRQAGTVLIEFHTSPTGEIFEAKLYESSGYPALDRAALENLKQGRWAGVAGYYLKAYLFKLN